MEGARALQRFHSEGFCPMRLQAAHSLFVAVIPIICALSDASIALAESARSGTEQEVATERAKGNFVLELALGTAGAALGSAASYFVLRLPAADCGGGDVPDLCNVGSMFAKAMVPLVLTPALTIVGVMSAGAATGGSGRFGITVLGAYAGVGAGLLVASVGSRLAGNTSLDVGLAMSLGAVGLLAGTLIGYRAWARPPIQVPLLALDRKSAVLLWSGRF